ncbi:MAG: sarcosine oxidase subunit delta [Lautropia sp.]|nr:sarcosine oxidase subunit delta [Lautropia sp.]
MLMIQCPWCGARAESEFNYGGEGDIVRPVEAASKDKDTWLTDEQWGDYVFMRKNTRGRFREQWVHTHGCRRWFDAERDTVTYQFLSTSPMPTATAQPTAAAPAHAKSTDDAKPADKGDA